MKRKDSFFFLRGEKESVEEVYKYIKIEGDKEDINCVSDPAVDSASGANRKRRGVGAILNSSKQSVNKFSVMYSNVDEFSQDKLRKLKHRLKESPFSTHNIVALQANPKLFWKYV